MVTIREHESRLCRIRSNKARRISHVQSWIGEDMSGSLHSSAWPVCRTALGHGCRSATHHRSSAVRLLSSAPHIVTAVRMIFGENGAFNFARPCRACRAASPELNALRHAELLLQAGRRGRVLEGQLLVRMDVAVRLLRHQRALVEAGQDQLELARIGVDVADREDAGLAGLERRGVDRDQRPRCSSRPQFATGPSFMVSPKNGSMASQAMWKVEPSLRLTLAAVSWPSVAFERR